MLPSSILVIDTQNSDLFKISQALRPTGQGLLWADDPADGLRMMAEAKPYLIFISDELEGVEDPLEFLHKASDLNIATQIVILTQRPDFEKAMNWITEGIFAICPRPLKCENIKKIIAKAGEQQELFNQLLVTSRAFHTDHQIYKRLANQMEIPDILSTLNEIALEITGAIKAETRLADNFYTPQIKFSNSSNPQSTCEIHLELSHDSTFIGTLTLGFADRTDLDKLDQPILDELTTAGSLFLHQAKKYLEAFKLASRDALTGLFNRRIFMEILEKEFNQANRHNTPLSLIMLDLDHFKTVNDTFGHQTGDEILKWLAQVINKVIRSEDLAARIGGEEFAIILPQSTLEQAQILSQRLKETLATSPLPSGNAMLRQTISQGIASIDHFLINSTEDLIYWSDQAMYLAKKEGRDTIRLFTNLPLKSKPEDGQYAFQ